MASVPVILAVPSIPPPPTTPPPRTCKKRQFSSPVFTSENSAKRPVQAFANFLRFQATKLNSSNGPPGLGPRPLNLSQASCLNRGRKKDHEISILLLKGRYPRNVTEDQIKNLNQKLRTAIPTLPREEIDNDLKIHEDRTFTIVLCLPEGACLKKAMGVAQKILIQKNVVIT